MLETQLSAAISAYTASLERIVARLDKALEDDAVQHQRLGLEVGRVETKVEQLEAEVEGLPEVRSGSIAHQACDDADRPCARSRHVPQAQARGRRAAPRARSSLTKWVVLA